MTTRIRRPSSSLRFAPASLAAALLFVASSASAQQSACPPGSWFCADTAEKPAAPAGQPVTPAPAGAAATKGLEPLPPPEQAPPPPPPQPAQTVPPSVIYQPAPPVVVYQPPPPVVIREAPPPYYYHPRAPSQVMPRREWGLNLHLEGAMMGHGASNNSGMGGIGAGLRYKPVPAFGIEADVDFYGGRDYYDDKRTESAFALNALVFVNPRSRAQVYFLAGFGWAGAHVENDHTSSAYSSQDYRYFGGQAGVGLEFRASRHFALNVDVRGFIRGRTDEAAQYQPEFVDANGRTTNTSGGALLTGGMTFYF